jgi:hypothetical protein
MISMPPQPTGEEEEEMCGFAEKPTAQETKASLTGREKTSSTPKRLRGALREILAFHSLQ